MTDSVLVIGGGVAGLTAAMECAQAGAQVIVVEQEPVVGGQLAAALTDDGSLGDGVDCQTLPGLARVAANERIEVLVLADLVGLEGRPGNFLAKLRQRARFVTDTCTRCNKCRPVCPSVTPNKYDAGLTYRKAIYTPLPQTVPPEYVIDIDTCLNTPPNYLPCNRCIEVCEDDSIHFDLPRDTRDERQVAAVIVATGAVAADSGRLQQYGYGAHSDIVTTAELQRLLIAPGPTGGFAAKPSNEDCPDSVLFIVNQFHSTSSQTVASQIHQLVGQGIEKIGVLVLGQPDTDSVPEAMREVSAKISICWGIFRGIEVVANNRIAVSYADFVSNRVPKTDYDMVVLESAYEPAAGLEYLSEIMGIELNRDGYVARQMGEHRCATTAAGIYVAGSAAGATTLAETLVEAKAAAMAALAHLDPRLLHADYVPPDAPAEATTEQDTDELRARIERALYALLDQRG